MACQTQLPYVLLSHTIRKSSGVRSFPQIGRNLLLPLDIQNLDTLSVKCLILFEVKSIFKMATHAGKMAASKYGKIQDGCLHSQKPCGNVHELGHSWESVLCQARQIFCITWVAEN